MPPPWLPPTLTRDVFLGRAAGATTLDELQDVVRAWIEALEAAEWPLPSHARLVEVLLWQAALDGATGLGPDAYVRLLQRVNPTTGAECQVVATGGALRSCPELQAAVWDWAVPDVGARAMGAPASDGRLVMAQALCDAGHVPAAARERVRERWRAAHAEAVRGGPRDGAGESARRPGAVSRTARSPGRAECQAQAARLNLVDGAMVAMAQNDEALAEVVFGLSAGPVTVQTAERVYAHPALGPRTIEAVLAARALVARLAPLLARDPRLRTTPAWAATFEACLLGEMAQGATRVDTRFEAAGPSEDQSSLWVAAARWVSAFREADLARPEARQLLATVVQTQPGVSAALRETRPELVETVRTHPLASQAVGGAVVELWRQGAGQSVPVPGPGGGSRTTGWAEAQAWAGVIGRPGIRLPLLASMAPLLDTCRIEEQMEVLRVVGALAPPRPDASPGTRPPAAPTEDEAWVLGLIEAWALALGRTVARERPEAGGPARVRAALKGPAADWLRPAGLSAARALSAAWPQIAEHWPLTDQVSLVVALPEPVRPLLAEALRRCLGQTMASLDDTRAAETFVSLMRSALVDGRGPIALGADAEAVGHAVVPHLGALLGRVPLDVVLDLLQQLGAGVRAAHALAIRQLVAGALHARPDRQGRVRLLERLSQVLPGTADRPTADRPTADGSKTTAGDVAGDGPRPPTARRARSGP